LIFSFLQVTFPPLNFRQQYAMAGTPQLRSAFPQTPQKQKGREQNETSRELKPQVVNGSKSSVGSPQDIATPLIPVEIVEAPSQRLYVLAFYVALNTCRVYESWVATGDLDTTWLFLKWGFIDIVFLFGLQALRIPWLDWTFSTSFMVLLLHITANLFLMFRIPVRLDRFPILPSL
jgi:nucleoporin POM152